MAICGPSGSGKSTLIRLINQLETLSSGEIFIHQRSTAGLRGRQLLALRTSIGFVFQQFNLYTHLTALDNVALAIIKMKLRQVELADKVQYFPHQLSGGASSSG
ncbi:amino acid ABC transporter ATP-binding protein [Sodalis-like endosymbiont of Proechinophthirus fluctus]|uniref:ATP-binding cassette domain-containing protein n=1 Tax=Sodalis-like endosymbiont of Proechinophthirus fluctus TaxID=1462730 RepID=UPI00082E20F7